PGRKLANDVVVALTPYQRRESNNHVVQRFRTKIMRDRAGSKMGSPQRFLLLSAEGRRVGWPTGGVAPGGGGAGGGGRGGGGAAGGGVGRAGGAAGGRGGGGRGGGSRAGWGA